MQNWDLSLPFTEHLNPVPKKPQDHSGNTTKFINSSGYQAELARGQALQDGHAEGALTSSGAAPPKVSLVQTLYRPWIYSCTTHPGVTSRKGCGEVWSLTSEGTGLGADHGTLRQNIAIFPGVPDKVSAHILAHGWQSFQMCHINKMSLWPT